MKDSREEFVAGYLEGWRMIMGKGAATPAIPMASAYVGGSTREAGLLKGIEDAQKRKARNAKPRGTGKLSN